MNRIIFKENFHKIQFKCRSCGHCCRNSQIKLSPYDIIKICELEGISTRQFHQKYSYFTFDKENQDILTCMLKTSPECFFLKDNKCAIYQHRPISCRTFPLAIQPFFKGNNLDLKHYILEECPGFSSKGRITLAEFKEMQGIEDKDLENFYSPWMKFKIKMINTSVPRTEEYHRKFIQICYDFDNILAKLNRNLSSNEKYKLVIKLAEKQLLEPYL